MTPQLIVQRFRLFLLLLAAFMSAGTIIELFLEEHTAEPMQWLPFILCGLGLSAVLVVLARPQRMAIQALRLVMLPTGLGGLLGMIEHLKGNFSFAAEIRPNAALTQLFIQALSGADPLLAPGILTLIALIASAATYYHPALSSEPG